MENSSNDLTNFEGSKGEFWQIELKAAIEWLDKFHASGEIATRRYMDRRDDVNMDDSASSRKFNLFWANVSTIVAALFSRLPKADVGRRNTDYEDDVARVAAEMLQRVLNSDVEKPTDDLYEACKRAVEDRFIPGLGQVWVRFDYDKTQQPVNDPMGMPMIGPDGQPMMQDVISNERAPVDYVHWKDFLWSPARVWSEVRWVARRVYMTRDALVERFGEEVGNLVQLDAGMAEGDKGSRNDENSVEKASPWKYAAIWEVWNKPTKTVCWVSLTSKDELDTRQDPLGLTTFFPCPKPLHATVVNSAFIPKSDYAMVQDQYQELDVLNIRINLLVETLRVAGVYDAKADGIKQLLTRGSENTLIPVDNWALFGEKGGLKGSVDWLPIDMVAEVIDRLRVYRQDLMQQLYELLGISDIQRGQTAASETLGAQKLKVAFGGARLQALQTSLAEFVQEALRIRAEIACNHYSPEALIEQSQILMTPDKQLAGPATQLLKDKRASGFRIEVNADSISAPDWEIERQGRTEFLMATGNFVKSFAPMIQMAPGSLPFVLQMLQWAAASFKSAGTIEGVLDQAIKAAQSMPQQQQQKPDPVQVRAQADAMKIKMQTQSDMQLNQQETQSEAMLEQQRFGNEQQLQQADVQNDMQKETQKFMADLMQTPMN